MWILLYLVVPSFWCPPHFVDLLFLGCLLYLPWLSLVTYLVVSLISRWRRIYSIAKIVSDYEKMGCCPRYHTTPIYPCHPFSKANTFCLNTFLLFHTYCYFSLSGHTNAFSDPLWRIHYVDKCPNTVLLLFLSLRAYKRNPSYLI